MTERTYYSFAEILCLVPIAVHKPTSSVDLMPVHGHTHTQKHRKKISSQKVRPRKTENALMRAKERQRTKCFTQDSQRVGF